MKRLSQSRILPLRRVVAAREMACRSELDAVLRDENAVRRAISGLSAGDATATPDVDCRAADRWRSWQMVQKMKLQRDLASILARKEAAQKSLGLAAAKTQSVERLCDLVTAEYLKDRERRREQAMLTTELLSRHQRRGQSS